MDRNARIRIGIATLIVAFLAATLTYRLAAAQTSPSVSSGYTLDGDSVRWELAGKGRITVSPHTTHGRWDAVRTQEITFESYLGTEENITCGLAFAQRPRVSELSLQKQRTVQVQLYDPQTNATAGYGNVTEDYWQDVTSQLTMGKKAGKFFGYGTFAVPALGTKTFQVRYLLNESEAEDAQGRKKWEMRCWQGSFASPAWEINLDPWADNITCLGYYAMDSNVSNTTHTYNHANCTMGDLVFVDSPQNTTGKIDEGFYFDSTGDYMKSIGTTGINGAEPMTISLWAKYNNTAAGYTWSAGARVANKNRALQPNEAVPSKYYFTWHGTDFTTALGSSPTGDWHFITVTYNGTHFSFYANGTYVESTPIIVDTTDSLFVLFQRSDFAGLDVVGTVDEVSIFAEALNADQIANMYANGTASLWSSPGTSSANESAGRAAIVAGIAASTASTGTIDTGRQVTISYLNGTQKLGTFDKVLAEGNQRWLFNYNTTGESYTGMEGISPALFVWENESLTAAQITAQVSAFINTTDT